MRIGCYTVLREFSSRKGVMCDVECNCGTRRTLGRANLLNQPPKSCSKCRSQKLTYRLVWRNGLIEIHFNSGHVSIVNKEALLILQENPRCTMTHQYVHVTISKTKKETLLHRLIMGLDKFDGGMVVDHINGNKLDNRVCNLRVVSQSVNCMNKQSSNVSFSKRNATHPWRAYVSFNKKQMHLGYYSTKHDADTAIKGYFKLFRYFEGQKTIQRQIE